MMRNEICERYADHDSEKCETCKERVCRVCGCTWDNACDGGCYWVEFDLCNKCVGKEPEPFRLIYTFDIKESIYGLDHLLKVMNEGLKELTGYEIIRSRLESPDEVCEIGEWDDNS